jgi:superfamily I DNA and/or RNA helicase
VFYGPNNNVIELKSISKVENKFQDWIGGGKVLVAIKLGKFTTELQIFDMLDQLKDCPLVKSIIGQENVKSIMLHPKQTQKQIQSVGNPNETDNGLEDAKDCIGYEKSLVLESFETIFEKIILNAINEFNLNTDQAKVLTSFTSSILLKSKPIVLVHGVYGSGKSFVLCVLIISLYRCYNIGILNEQTRIVVSSQTNVAVDRILKNLVDLGHEDFVRIGSIKKIAKSILPFTCHHKTESSTMKDLNELLANENNEEDQEYIKRAIKKFQEQENQVFVRDAFVIGITTASCSFELLDGLICPIVILDECSQMTEPMSLLPCVKFKCSFGVFVGDPKQLGPTLVTTLDHNLESQNEFGIERTLFERLTVCGYVPVMLRTQYRCHPEISRITNECFYAGKIINGHPNIELIQNLEPCIYIETKSEETKVGGSYQNNGEVKLVERIVKKLVETGIETSEIGVISLCKILINKINLKQTKFSYY